MPSAQAVLPLRDDAPGRSLRSAADLIAAGLVGAERQAALEAVGARYAVAVTPALAALIDPRDPADPIARQFVPDVRELDWRLERSPIRSATTSRARSKVWCIAIPTGCC